MEENKKYIFEKLPPVSDSEIGIYEAAIDFVFKNDDVKNVAISGAYGAGKSSVLASYKIKHPGKKFMHISLAHFRNGTDENGDNGYIKESILEGKILNQLIHQMPAEKIPQTNFRVKKSTGNRAVYRHTATIAFFMLTLLHILLFDNWTLYINSIINSIPARLLQQVLSLSTAKTSLLVSGSICFAMACVFLFRILLMQTNRNIFKKFSFQGNEIEIFEESDDSYFDKYLNEVLYLFENVEAGVVVFEDMDRFDANRIFERLREINTLVNLQRKKDDKPILRFFYLLRDDIFISKDRTKFFDYIIPIVPVVDSSNSYNKFIDHLSKNDMLSGLNEGLLQGVSLYVDDMRLLKNICNEFLIYYNTLNTTELDRNRMFALIIYKNLFPRDFSDLQLNKGFVYALFNSKERIIAKAREKLKEEIGSLNKRISDANTEVATSQSDLDLIFQPKRTSYYPPYYSGTVLDDYNRRLQAINDRNRSAMEKLEKERSECETKLQKIESAPLASIITRENIDEVFSLKVVNEVGDETDFSEIKRSEYFALIKYLIRNGYIDETYSDYMTYFYENSLSRVDKTFLRSVTDKKAKPYNYELKTPEMVFARLQPIDFDQEETKNFMLCDYLLRYKSQSDHLARFISQLRNSKSYAFISQYFNYTKQFDLFVQVFNEQWPTLFVDMQSEGGFSSEQLHAFTVHVLYFVEPEMLTRINEDDVLTEYINGTKDFLAIEEPQLEKLVSAFIQLGVCFSEIEYDCSDKGLLFAVYENDLYELNFRNVAMFLKNVWKVASDDDIRHKNYTIISNDKNAPLYKRIESDMSEYVGIFLRECDGEITDDEHIAVELLSCKEISNSQKKEYIKCLRTPLSVLSSVEDHSVWETLLGTRILLLSEQNVLDYFCFKNELDSALINFINSAKHTWDFSPESIALTEDQRSSFFDQVLACNKIHDNQYENILISLNTHCEEFTVPNIHESKMRILINNGIIRMDSETLEYLRDQYSAIIPVFIKRNIENYADIMDSELFSQEELLDILSWEIEDSIKLRLLAYSDDEISTLGMNYSVPVRVHILTHNLSQDDMKALYFSYSDEHRDIQKVIFKHARENIDDIIRDPCGVDDLLQEELLKAADISSENRIELFAAILENSDIGPEETCRYLSILGLDEYIKIFDSHSKPKFKKTMQNRMVLDAFKEKGWIFEYLDDDFRSGYYKIRRRESRKS